MRISRVHKRALSAVLGMLWLSGVAWLLSHYLLRQPGDFGLMPHPAEKWGLRLHGLAVFGVLVALGSLIPAHGTHAWKVRRQRPSGLLLLLLSIWLAVSGYALYYLVGDRETSWLPVLHWAVGLLTPLFLVSHLWRRRFRLTAPVSVEGAKSCVPMKKLTNPM